MQGDVPIVEEPTDRHQGIFVRKEWMVFFFLRMVHRYLLVFSFQILAINLAEGVPDKLVMRSNWCTTFFLGNNYFLVSISSGCNIVCPETSWWHIIKWHPNKPKITHLQFAVGISKNIFFFFLASNLDEIHLLYVYILDPKEAGTRKKLIVLGSKIIICLNYWMKIIFDQFKNNVNISRFSPRRREHDMFYFYNIRMLKQP